MMNLQVPNVHTQLEEADLTEAAEILKQMTKEAMHFVFANPELHQDVILIEAVAALCNAQQTLIDKLVDAVTEMKGA